MEEKKEEVHARVSQAVITDIGSAIVGATKAHRPEASQDERKGTAARTEERWRGTERKTLSGVRGDREYGAIHRQSHARISAHLDAPFFSFSLALPFSVFLIPVEL